MFVPTPEETRVAAFYRWEQRGKADGHDQFDYFEGRNDLIMNLNYRELVSYQLSGAPGKIKLGTQDAPCRFCGKSRPEVRFKSTAHAIPELMGNDRLIDRNECDTCNGIFSKLETIFSDFLLPVRATCGMSGKTGVPTYVSKTSKIETVAGKTTYKQDPADPILIPDPANNRATMPLKVKSYIPIGVYKCLTKMALSIMPDDEAQHFRRTREWILNLDHIDRIDCFKGHFAYLFFIPGPNPIEHAWAKLLRRRDDTNAVPHVIFVVGTGNLIFQTFVPISRLDDWLDGKQFKIPRYGLPTGPGSQFGPSTVGRMPLDRADKIKNSAVDIVQHVGAFIQ